MGRRSQERMTGLSYEERVRVAKMRGLRRKIRRLLRLNKPEPKHYANVRRDGRALVNPKLLKRNTPEKADLMAL